MVNAQNWLNDTYDLPDYDTSKPLKEIISAIEYKRSDINQDRILEGALIIKNFSNLQILSLPCHKLTSVKISGCPKLEVVELFSNELTNFEVDYLDTSKKIKEINLADNNFTRVSQIKPSYSSSELKKLFLHDNNFVSQDLSEIESLIMQTHINKLSLGSSEEGVQKGKHNKFYGSMGNLFNYESTSGKLDLDISGTDIDEGLEENFGKLGGWSKISLKCKPRRDGDKVKKIYDQLGQPADSIVLDKNNYKDLLKKGQKQQEEAKKWEPVKTQYQAIFTKISNSDCWEAIKLYKSLYEIKTPEGEMPNELGTLCHQARMKTHELIENFAQKQVKKEDITDEQLEILEKDIIPFEQRLVEHMHNWGWIDDQQKQENIEGLKNFLQRVQAEKQHRKNPSSPPTGGNGGNNSDPFFGNTPTNLPTDKGTPSPNQQQDGPKQNSPDNSKNNDKNGPGGPQKDNKSDSTDQKNKEKIDQSKNIEEARENAKQILTEIFQNTSVKLSDLDKTLWGNEKNPEEYLKKLTSKEEITKFIQKLRQNVKEKEAKNNQPNNSNNEKGKGALLGFGIAFAVLVVGVILTVIIRNKRRKKKNWER